jgi:recombination protein RecA
MDYKLLPAYRGRFAVDPVFRPMRYELMALPVIDVQVKEPGRSMHRYDIEVEGSHNYLVNGVVVHNSPEVTPGGRALKFYSSIRLDIRRIEAIKDGADVVGNRTRVKVVKNKCSAPFKQAEFDIMYGRGISREGSLLDVAVELGFIKKSGAWFTYEGEQLGQGRENVKTFLSENPQLMVEINDRVREYLAPTGDEDGDAAPAEAVDSDDLPITLDS